ncbi:MAG: PH domain-containing protein [Acidobacteriota bacterium]|nr:PH domain-containing protein [Acidobacteriota bacterium]
MSYVEKNLVPGETLLYQTRHHWIVLLGPLFIALLLGLPGVWVLYEAAAKRPELEEYVARIPGGMQTALIVGAILVVVALINLGWGMTKRNATEMAVTNRRVLIKTGLGSRRTLDLMLSRVESIGVVESMWGRMLGYGNVIVHGTGGTPESFVLISHPQEFRRQVQQQIGAHEIGGSDETRKA